MTSTVRSARIVAGMTQAQLGDAIGMSRQGVNSIENGSCPSLPNAMRMARALDSTVLDLFSQHDPDTTRDARRTGSRNRSPCLAVNHVTAPDGMVRLMNRLVMLREQDVSLARRGQDLSILMDGEVLLVCEDASGWVDMDEKGAMRLVDMVLPSVVRATRGGDTQTIVRQNGLLHDIGRMISGRMGPELHPVTELLVEAPMPWNRGGIVRPDQQSGIGMWADPRPDLGEFVPEMPSILQFIATDGVIHAKGWGRRVILKDDVPDAMEVLRLCAGVESAARALMEEAGR
jgi:putative transcriptional regulator